MIKSIYGIKLVFDKHKKYSWLFLIFNVSPFIGEWLTDQFIDNR